MNAELLRKVMDRIDQEAARDPGSHAGRVSAGRWNQLNWRTESGDECGTAMCFAGWACELSGGKWLAYPYDEYLEIDPDDDSQEIVDVSDDDSSVTWGIHASSRARRLLGLNYDQSGLLFKSTNTLADLRGQVAGLTAAQD